MTVLFTLQLEIGFSIYTAGLKVILSYIGLQYDEIWVFLWFFIFWGHADLSLKCTPLILQLFTVWVMWSIFTSSASVTSASLPAFFRKCFQIMGNMSIQSINSLCLVITFTLNCFSEPKITCTNYLQVRAASHMDFLVLCYSARWESI